jgi:hypothetical protein
MEGNIVTMPQQGFYTYGDEQVTAVFVRETFEVYLPALIR